MPQEFVQHICCIQDALADQYIYTLKKKKLSILSIQLICRLARVYILDPGCIIDSVHIQPAHALVAVKSTAWSRHLEDVSFHLDSNLFPPRFKFQSKIKEEMYKRKNSQNGSAHGSSVSTSSFQNWSVEVCSRSRANSPSLLHHSLHSTLSSLQQLGEFQALMWFVHLVTSSRSLFQVKDQSPLNPM